MTIRSLFLTCAVLVAGSAAAQLPTITEVPPGQLDPADVTFILDANTSNITQIAMGHAADSKAANPGIASLADKIVSSHMKADSALQMLASRKHVDLPRRAASDDHAEIADLHDKKRGGSFDAQYVRNVIDDHDRMIAMYIAARSESLDADIRAYADVMLPALRENRDQALAMQNKQLGASSGR